MNLIKPYKSLIMKYKSFLFAFVLVTVSVGFSSCESCSHKVELFISDVGLGDWDINGDGEAGRDVVSPTFQGKKTMEVKNSCNIDSHKCAFGVDGNNDGWCDNCKNNGYECHMAKHQPR